MKKITPFLWFDKDAGEAAEFYVTEFGEGSEVRNLSTIPNTPSGDSTIVSFDLCGQPFQALSAGPFFRINPSISFQVKCQSKDEVERLWDRFSPGAKVLMELGSYPFNERFGWIQDKYGLSWQLVFAGKNKISQKIMPIFLFTGAVCGRSEEAMNFYASVFPQAQAEVFARYGKGAEPEREGTVQFGSFRLDGQEFGAMDSAREQAFAFNEAISFLVPCENQHEIDYYWEKLSAVPQAEQCGWLKDKFGLSWQIVPTTIADMFSKGSREEVERISQALMKMKKIDMEALNQAKRGA